MNNNKKNPGDWLGRIRQYSDRTINDALLRAYRAIAETHDLKELNLLDVGCGGGSLTREFSSNAQNSNGVSGCDISKESIEFCSELNPRINYFVQDALKPLPEDRIYDVIVFTAALAQFNREEQYLVLANSRRQLSRDGYLLILDVNSERTGPLFAHFEKSAIYEVVIKKIFGKRFFGKTPGVMLADRVPFALLEVLEKIVPGDNILRLTLLRVRG